MTRLEAPMIMVRVLCMSALMLSGCAKAAVTTPPPVTAIPPIAAATPVSASLPTPDRILVHDFAVLPVEGALDRRLLTDNLIKNLRDHGILAVRAGRALPPGPTTASITGEFLRLEQGGRTLLRPVGFGLGDSKIQARVQIYQGAGQTARLVAEGETTVEADAKRTADAVAERIVNFYRRQGWIGR